jgi:phosphate starvation-inducible PhoH-like protein
MGFCPTMELTIQVASNDEAMALFGTGDRNLKLLRDAFDVQLTGRGSTLKLQGDPQPVEKVAGILQGLIDLLRRGEKIEPGYVAGEVRRRGGVVPADAGIGSDPQTESRPDLYPPKGGARAAAVKPPDRAAPAFARSDGQAEYLRAMQANDIVFCIGPAGTGKTFLAVYMAVSLLREGSIRKIFLCRPAVEAGEKLGFLPGDFQAKINPYLRPLYDALNDIVEYEQL